MERSQLPPVGTPEFRAAREAAMANCQAPMDYVLSDPVGFTEGMRVSSRIVSHYRKHHRDNSLDVQPQEVIEVLEANNIENWVLMGLYGYVGYLADPRATQDVDVLVGREEQAATVTAINDRWPSLIVRETEVVIRFLDPGEKDQQGRPKPVIDVMLPWSHLHAEILKSEVVIDANAGVRHPTLEAAIAAKYAAMVSPNRQFTKKRQDAVDFRNIAVPNAELIDLDRLCELAELVWEGATPDMLELIDAAKNDRPFDL